MPTSWWTYDFGYSWPYTSGHLLVFLLGLAIAALCWWRAWPRWLTVVASVVALWGLAGSISVHHAIQTNEPQRLVTDAFLPSGNGRVLDLGAGSGRATVGLLQARPKASVTAVDLYLYRRGTGSDTNSRNGKMKGRATAAAGVP